MMTYDSHTHSAYSFDSAGGYSVDDMCRAAISKGITHLAITDHYDINAVLEGLYTAPDIEKLKEEIEAAKKKYRDRLVVSFGIELGSAIQYKKEALSFLEKYEFETVLASVHYMRGHDDFYNWDMKSLNTQSLENMWLLYLKDLEETVEFGRSDVLCHLTYPIRDVRLAGKELDISFSDDILERILKKVIKAQMLLEVNTSGYYQGLGEPLPDSHILGIYRDCGGRLISLASDAHIPRNIGASYANAARYLKKCGFSEVHFIKNKEIYKQKIQTENL